MSTFKPFQGKIMQKTIAPVWVQLCLFKAWSKLIFQTLNTPQQQLENKHLPSFRWSSVSCLYLKLQILFSNEEITLSKSLGTAPRTSRVTAGSGGLELKERVVVCRCVSWEQTLAPCTLTCAFSAPVSVSVLKIEPSTDSDVLHRCSEPSWLRLWASAATNTKEPGSESFCTPGNISTCTSCKAWGLKTQCPLVGVEPTSDKAGLCAPALFSAQIHS